MGTEIKVWIGVCQTDFYNQKFFENVFDGLHKPLQIFKIGKYEHIGVLVKLIDGKATEENISKAFSDFEGNIPDFMGSMPQLKLFTVGG